MIEHPRAVPRTVVLCILCAGLAGCSATGGQRNASVVPSEVTPSGARVFENDGTHGELVDSGTDDSAGRESRSSAAETPEMIAGEIVQTAQVEGRRDVPDAAASPVEIGDAPPPAPTTESPQRSDDSRVVPIDFATALSLTAGQNPQVAFAQAQIREAFAQVKRAEVLWLPSIRLGANYNKHEGTIQDVEGNIFDTSRGAVYGGLGARGIGAGSPSVPGVVVDVHVADAVFQPRIAGAAAHAQQHTAAATLNDELLESALAYLNLLDALQQQEIARETVENTTVLTDLTDAFARSGQGTEADADRAAAAAASQRGQQLRAEEAFRVASARLAQQLRMDPTLSLIPTEPTVAPIALVPPDAPVQELVAVALETRHELTASKLLVSEACQRLRREKYAPLLPSVLLWANYGGMAGGLGSTIAEPGDRFDFDAVAYWEVRNLGFGESAARSLARSRVDQARLRQVQVMDTVAREVAEAHAQVESRRRQIEVAREAIAAAQGSHRRNLERIREGQGLPIEVLQSIQALDQSRREYLRAVVSFNEAQFRLHRALGWPVGC